MKKRITRRAALGALAASAALPRALAQSAATTLPETISWTAYDVGSGSYNQGVAVGNALKARLGVNLRLLPGRNDVARLVPLRENRVMFSANGVAGAYFAQEGVYDFAGREWGPQPVRAILLNNGDALLTIATAKDAGATTLRDLKGKRVAWVVGADALNQNITAMLAFAELTWADVQKVEFPGFGAAMQAMIAGRVDAAFASTISGPLYQLESSPRGLWYPPMPHADKAGWERLRKIAPYFVPAMGREGAGITPEKPVEGGSYPFPILMSYTNVSEPHAYGMAKAMLDLFADYKDAAPGNTGWALDRQIFSWVVPYHEGAVRRLREIGVWKDEHQRNNEAILRRQAVLAEAWKPHAAGSHASDEAFQQAWMKARAAALAAAGFDAVWRE